MGVRLLVCGGRNYNDYIKLSQVLRKIHEKVGIAEIIHGDATGADSMAGHWGSLQGIPVTPVPADWKGLALAAGPVRNKKMLDMKPDGVVAFPGGNGTKHMVSIARKAGVPVLEISVKED